MNIIKSYNSITEAGIELNIKHTGNITKCCNEKLKTAYGALNECLLLNLYYCLFNYNIKQILIKFFTY